jgi:N-acetylmuramoyl-L-alanine amidase
MKKVMIDPGHCVGNANKGPTGYYEYLGVWLISLFLQNILTAIGIQADLTRVWDDDPDLKVRGIQAQDYDLFISEHSNAGGGKGVEVFYDFEKEYDKVNAAKLSKAVAEVMGTIDRGAMIKTYTDDVNNYYGVIRNAGKTNCKHIFLIENGFHDNKEDEAFLKDINNLRKIALAQAVVICEILGVNINYRKILQSKSGIDNNTMQYIDYYRFGEPMHMKLAKAML